jgi:iron-sulfur cluster assembly accessory protein
MTSITLSDHAAKRVAVIVSKDKTKTALRISVKGGGCSGFSYQFDLVSAGEPDDFKLEKSGAIVFIDAMSLDYLEGSEIDFVDNLMGQSFQIKNPLAVSSCGCGVSFSL